MFRSLLPSDVRKRYVRDVRVLFVGKTETWSALSADAIARCKVERIFTVRWALVFRWLRVLKALNPHYRDVEIVDALKHQRHGGAPRSGGPKW